MSPGIPDPGGARSQRSGMTSTRLLITAVVVEHRPVADVAAQYGVSRSWLYELLARYRLEGEAVFEPRSRRPASNPNAISLEVVDLIVRVRKELADQGLDAGPDTICWHLAHHHQVTVSRATVARHLAPAAWSHQNRRSARSRPTSASKPHCRTRPGRPTSPTTDSPAPTADPDPTPRP
jgi:transposase